jgi:hypothetical protein
MVLLRAFALAIGTSARFVIVLSLVTKLGRLRVARINDYACDGRTVSTDPLSRTVHDDVRAMLNWVDQIASHLERIVDDQRDLVFVCDPQDDFFKDVML